MMRVTDFMFIGGLTTFISLESGIHVIQDTVDRYTIRRCTKYNKAGQLVIGRSLVQIPALG